MGITQAHTLYGVQLGSDLIGGITEYRLPTNTDCRFEALSGEHRARFAALYKQNPQGSFTTKAVAKAINRVTVAGLKLAGLSGGHEYWAQKLTDGGTRAAGAVHRKYSFAAGICVPRRLIAEHQGDATLQLETFANYDGTNDPIVMTENQTLPAGLADDQRFTIGKITVAGILLTHVRRLEVDFGLEVASEGSDSEIWDRFVYIKSMMPTITLRGVDVSWLKTSSPANIPLTGKACTQGNTILYLRKRADGGTFVADATAAHLKMTIAGTAYVEEALGAQSGELHEVSLVIKGKTPDGTADPLVVTIDQAVV